MRAAAAPNAAHLALGRLCTAWPDAVTLVTQNIDDLHEQGGARDVIHMHGSCSGRSVPPAASAGTRRIRCIPDDDCPACGQRATRPDVVWFGEMPYRMDEIFAALAAADLFVAIGTSGNVYPAAGFVMEARAQGARRWS